MNCPVELIKGNCLFYSGLELKYDNDYEEYEEICGVVYCQKSIMMSTLQHFQTLALLSSFNDIYFRLFFPLFSIFSSCGI